MTKNEEHAREHNPFFVCVCSAHPRVCLRFFALCHATPRARARTRLIGRPINSPLVCDRSADVAAIHYSNCEPNSERMRHTHTLYLIYNLRAH